MSLLMPRHMAQQVAKGKREAAATAIAKTAVHRMDSDDFLTGGNVQDQLDQLQAYIDLRKEEEPAYALPQPSGWKLMVLMLTIPETSAGGVIVVDDAKEARSMSSPQGVVLAMGSGAYSDEARFSINGMLVPWQACGDRIAMVKYDAAMFQIANGQRLGFITDTQPVATLDTGWKIPC